MLTREQKQYLRSSILRYRSPQNLILKTEESLVNSSSKQPNYFLGCALSNKNQNYFIAPKHCYHNRTMTEQSHNSVDIVRVMVLILTFVKRRRLLNKQAAFKKLNQNLITKRQRDAKFVAALSGFLDSYLSQCFSTFLDNINRIKQRKEQAVVNMAVLLLQHEKHLKYLAIKNIEIKAVRQHFVNKSLSLFVTQLQNLQKSVNLRVGFSRLKIKAMRTSQILRNRRSAFHKLFSVQSSHLRSYFHTLLNVRQNRLTYRPALKRSDSQQSQNPQDSHSQTDEFKPLLLFKSDKDEYSIYLNDFREPDREMQRSMHGEEVSIERITALSFNINSKKVQVRGDRRDISPNQRMIEFLDRIELQEKVPQVKGRSQTLKKSQKQQRGSLKNSLFFLFQSERQDRFIARAVKRSQTENIKEQTENQLVQRIKQIDVERSPSNHKRNSLVDRWKSSQHNLQSQTNKKKVKLTAMGLLLVAFYFFFVYLF